jgi:glycosyltransferase involved in cell wall biosynthesis
MGMFDNRRVYSGQKPRILYIDMAYTLKMCRERDLEQMFASRECGGYFDHVWAVHPIADIAEKRSVELDGFKLSISEFSKDQTIIEGVSAYYLVLKHFFPINFLISQIRFAAYLVGLVKREHISIVYCTDPYFGGLMGLLLKLLTGTSLVIWVIANFDILYKDTGALAFPRIFRWRWVEKIVENIVFRLADLVAAGSPDILKAILNNGATPKKTVYFPIGRIIYRQHMIEPGLRECDEFFITSQAEHHFIYVGRLLALKRTDDVLRAFSLINQNVSNCALILAGDGPMRADLEKLAHELGISDKVHFLGYISQKRLAKLLARCTIYLSPLTGGALLEAALASLPIVAYDIDWPVEFLRKDDAGVIVPFGDWHKMGEEAVQLLRHPEEAIRMGGAARRNGLEACDLEKIYGYERSEFDKLLKRELIQY